MSEATKERNGKEEDERSNETHNKLISEANERKNPEGQDRRILHRDRA